MNKEQVKKAQEIIKDYLQDINNSRKYNNKNLTAINKYFKNLLDIKNLTNLIVIEFGKEFKQLEYDETYIDYEKIGDLIDRILKEANL